MTRTKIEAELEAAESLHEADPERAECLQRARRFKTSWIELAEGLTNVRRGGQWKKWGSQSFEEYAKKELHLRQETVDKLTGSFAFLQKRAPEVLRRDGVTARVPSYQSVDFLRRAETQSEAPTEIVQAIHKRVIEDNAPLPSVSREYKEQVFPIDAGAKKQRDVAGIKNVATRLRELLGETNVVPRKLAGEVSSTLDCLLESLGVDEEAAA